VDVQNARVRAQRVANRQAGRINRAQLTYLEIGRGRIEGWVEEGYLIPTLPGVFAIGHAAPSGLGELFAALLYAGPGAMLSHMTAAWWRELIDYPPRVVHVRTPRRCKSLPTVEVHRESTTERTWCKGVRVTSVAQTMLDLAASGDLRLVRKALGRLDFRYELDLPALTAICGRGRTGSTLLLQAIAMHDPRFGETNSPLEDDWLVYCEEYDVPKPDHIGIWLHGIEVDAYYETQRLAIQLDGGGNHHSAAQMRRDHRDDMTLRSQQIAVNRYSRDLLRDAPLTVRADVLAALAARA
jgi:hypothetical protein